MKYQVRIMIKKNPDIKTNWEKITYCYKIYDSNTMAMSLPKWWEAVQNELSRKGYVGEVFLQACVGNPFGANARYTETDKAKGFKKIAVVVI